jgi:hypothetical protein
MRYFDRPGRGYLPMDLDCDPDRRSIVHNIAARQSPVRTTAS